VLLSNPDQRFSLSTTCRQGERLGCGEGERGIEGFITIYLGRRGLASSGAAPVEARGGGLGIGERGAQNFSMSTTTKNAKGTKMNEFVL